MNEKQALITSDLCIQTRNTVIVCLYSKNGGYPLREYMITTTGSKIYKPLFQELEQICMKNSFMNDMKFIYEIVSTANLN